MAENLTVRPASRSDDAALCRLDVAAADPGSYVAPPRSEGPFFSANTVPADVFVAEWAGRLVGYVKVRSPTPLPSNAHVQQIQGLAVHPAARRRGVASALLAAALAEARRRGGRKLSLRVLGSNPGGLALYQARGFHVEGVLRDEFSIAGGGCPDDIVYTDDIVMARDL